MLVGNLFGVVVTLILLLLEWGLVVVAGPLLVLGAISAEIISELRPSLSAAARCCSQFA